MATLSTTQSNDLPALSPTTPLVQLASPVARDMQEFEQCLNEQLQPRSAELQPLLAHCGDLSGKRLRPLLLLLTARACGPPNGQQIRLAACVEMIHLATLVHDDILDEADQRRHRPTAHRLWGHQAAVLLGDYLFTHSFYLASTTGDVRACQILGQATNRVCEGELRQIRTAGDTTLDEATYMSIVEGKTGALCECSSELGARCAAATPAWQHAMARFGRDMGIAFQIMDDLLDILGTERRVGKSLGTDLTQVKLTLPLIHALREANAGARQEILALVAEPEGRAARLLSWYERLGSIGYTRQVAEGFVRTAMQQLELLPDSPARRALESIGPFVLCRDH